MFLFIILLYVIEIAARTTKQSEKPVTMMQNLSNDDTKTTTMSVEAFLRRGDIVTESASTIDNNRSMVNHYTHEINSSLLDVEKWNSGKRIHADKMGLGASTIGSVSSTTSSAHEEDEVQTFHNKKEKPSSDAAFSSKLSAPIKSKRLRARKLQEGEIDFSFITNKPMDEWSEEQWGLFIAFITLLSVLAFCCCCCCCIIPCISSCCRRQSYGNGYYNGYGNYGYGGYGGRGQSSSCLQDLICLWCFWELCCTDNIIEPGGYEAW